MLWTLVWNTYLYLMKICSGLVFVLYGYDKFQAQSGGWRVSERTLHMLEASGGWPGALLAQNLFHHKNRKSNYQFSFKLAMAVNILSLVLLRFLLA